MLPRGVRAGVDRPSCRHVFAERVIDKDEGGEYMLTLSNAGDKGKL